MALDCFPPGCGALPNREFDPEYFEQDSLELEYEAEFEDNNIEVLNGKDSM
jgi:hypothetical protein